MINNIGHRRLIGVLILSALTGILIGFVGGLFHYLVRMLFELRNTQIHILPYTNSLGWLYSMLGTTALVLFSVYLVRTYSPESAGSGVQEIEGALQNQRKIIWHRVVPVKFIGGLASLSSGMDLGREGPTIQMGGALGKMVSDFFKLKDEDYKILLSAGAGAGLTTAFNAPLAGILFVIEEMRKEFSYNFLSVASVATACISSNIVLIAFFGNSIDIPLPNFQDPNLSSLWLFGLLGLIFGVVGLVFNKFLVAALDWFSNKKESSYYVAATIFSLLLGLIIWFIPYFGGGGNLAIEQSFAIEHSLIFLAALFILRFMITIFSYGIGAPGGIFSPMIALGVTGGLLFAQFINFLPLPSDYPKEMFAIAGMGALFAATVRAPLTGIILVMEITQSFELILPLILTMLIATVVSAALGNKPIYSILLKRTLDIQKYGKDEYFRQKISQQHTK